MVRIRIGQYFRALGARRRPPDLSPARTVLSPPLFELLAGMPPEDQRHGLAVLSLLWAAGQRDRLLLQAALLHDVGKSGGGVRLHHRIVRVLLCGRLRVLWQWLSARPTDWRRPFWVVAHHPALGADWVLGRGAAPELADLIRYHEAPAPAEWAGTDLGRWHAALAWADAQD